MMKSSLLHIILVGLVIVQKTPLNLFKDQYNLKALIEKCDNSKEENYVTSYNVFDHQFNLNHSLEPNFNYYDTHEFHMLKDRI